jgi:AcrR family transcriptional regulator
VARRTQAERSTKTREALLDATVDALVEVGFARVSTREVAARAGVTIGALQHHFPTKADLVIATLEHLDAVLTRELVERPPRGETEYELAGNLLDRLWEIFRGPGIAAMEELVVAARTDAELRDRLAVVQRQAVEGTAAVGGYFFPRAAERGALAPLVDTALATIRGLTLLGFADRPLAERMWRESREHLLTLLFAPRTAGAAA